MDWVSHAPRTCDIELSLTLAIKAAQKSAKNKPKPTKWRQFQFITHLILPRINRDEAERFRGSVSVYARGQEPRPRSVCHLLGAQGPM